jgi:outer membrane protein OmpA-like peptidoglycan-associated protein
MRKNHPFIVATALLFVTSFSSLYAQSESELIFGIYGGVNTNNFIGFDLHPDGHAGTSSVISEADVAFFKNYSPSLGAFVNYPLTKSIIFSGRLGYTEVSGESTPSIRTGTDTIISQTLSFSSDNLEFSPTILFSNILFKNLYLLAGAEIGIPLSDTYSLTQRTSGGGTDTTQLLVVDEAMSRNKLRIAGVAGLGYNFNLGNIVILSPELTFRLPLTKFDISPAITDVSVQQIRFTAYISFLPEKYEPVGESHDLRVFIDTVGTYQADGDFSLLKVLKVEDVQYSELYPLVPYVFFEKNSGEPSNEFSLLKADERGNQNVVLQHNAMEINRQILHLVGQRMKSDFPQSLVKITGTTDGKTETKEVAQKRADFVKNYLLKTYDIAENRITTDVRALPLKPSVSTIAEGDAENRRIEFSSTTQELLAPIAMAGSKDRLATPELVEFRPSAISPDSITEWTLNISQSGRTLQEFKGTGNPKPVRWLIRPNELAASQVPVDYTFSAASKNLLKTAHGSLPVDYISGTRKSVEKLADKTVSKYSLILFDFDKADFTAENRHIIETTLLPALKYNSIVKIYGHTDKLGDEKHNRDLSLKRAQSVQNVLKSKVPSARYEIFGAGESTELFDNNSPIGRHLSRTVVVIIESPL